MENSLAIPEAFLHFIWENRLFYTHNLHTLNNEPVKIIDTGQKNNDSGPDFFNARIKIGSTIWAGNVEIHKKATDWTKHNHDKDKAYENVILHVVQKADKQIFRSNGTKISTLEIHWPQRITKNFLSLQKSNTWIACQEQFINIDPIILKLGFHRLMIERLERKTDEIIKQLKKNSYSWNETFYQMLARMFGFKINSTPFYLLAKSLPQKIIYKHKDDLFQIEALLYGTSGLLKDKLFGDDYYLNLRNEFNFFQKKYKIKPIESHLWKFMRLRPVNFPTIRISQFGNLIYRSQGLFSKITECKSIKNLQNLFKVQASSYWNNHYVFNKSSSYNNKKILGKNSINTIIINVIVPFLFVYGEYNSKTYLKDRALDFLEKLPPENNRIIEKWKKLGVKPSSAFDTQSLLQLKNQNCNNKNCLNCPIGNKIIKQTL